jgi:predicted dehydrogenase
MSAHSGRPGGDRMSPDVRVGIAGYGLAGEVFHAPLVAAAGGLAVAGVVTGDPERQARARAAHPGAAVVARVDELWGRIDLLVVAAPNRAHVPLALEAIERGVAVVVDKPLAITAAGAERVVTAAAAAGVPLTVFHNRRWDGDFLTLRRLVSEGALGEPTRLESRFERFRPRVKEGAWREAAAEEEGGGLLLDLGPHLVDQAIELLGPPRRVYAELDARRPGASVEDDAFVALEHAGGARSHLWMSAVAPLHGPRLAASGTRAGFAASGLDPQEAQLKDGMRPGDPGFGERGAEAAEAAGAAAGVLAGEHGRRDVPLERGAYERFYEAVVPWLRDGAPPPVDPRDAVAVMRVLEAARESAATHAVVALP